MIDAETIKSNKKIIEGIDFTDDLKKLVDLCWNDEKQKKNVIKSQEFLHKKKIKALYGSRVTLNCNPSEPAKCNHH